MYTIQSKNFRYTYTDMKNDVELRQFWKDFDHNFPTMGDREHPTTTTETLGHTVAMELNEPITTFSNKTVSVPNQDPKTAKTAVRWDSGKTSWNLLPMEALEEVVKVLEFGAQKYEANNWRRGDGFKYSRVVNSLLRHIFAWMKGEDRDPESGHSHLAHAGCNIIFLLYYNRYKERFNNDDRYQQ